MASETLVAVADRSNKVAESNQADDRASTTVALR
jgi:hypothetical protein